MAVAPQAAGAARDRFPSPPMVVRADPPLTPKPARNRVHALAGRCPKTPFRSCHFRGTTSSHSGKRMPHPADDRRCGFALLLTGGLQDAEDLVQLALLRSASRWSAARQRPNGYTRAGLVNLTRDRWWARRRRHATASPATRPSRCRLPGDVTAAVPGQQLLPRARQPPPVQQRAVLVLRLWQDHSVSETAAAVRPWRPIRQAVRPPRPHLTFRDASSSWP
jgi:hypothetical protein